MQETKDPPIKLFGTQILPVPSTDVSGDDVTSSGIDSAENQLHGGGGEDEDDGEGEIAKDPGVGKSLSMEEADVPTSNGEDSTTLETSHEYDIPKSPSMDEGTVKSEAPKTLKEGKNKPSSEEKTLKKPDKILPCPRCNSMDTKFCYYNNYNVNQPRHFCKSCQRYWTAGGTMRNVPVGAGRRKNKSSASHHNYQHVTISEALHGTRIDAPNGTHLMHFKSNGGAVLRLGLEAPRYDSVVSSCRPAETKVLNGTRNGFHNFEGGGVPCANGGNGDDRSSGSSITVSNSMDEESRSGQKEQKVGNNNNGYAPQMQCFPWPYPWNPAFPPGMAIPIYPAGAVWNCGMHSTWNIPSLGKHPREGEGSRDDTSKEEESLKRKNGSVLVPKTLRIDDPKEAAKSTIWATLGIKNDSSINNGLFKAFQQKGDHKNRRPETSPLLHANPAALSRSLKFHETS